MTQKNTMEKTRNTFYNDQEKHFCLTLQKYLRVIELKSNFVKMTMYPGKKVLERKDEIFLSVLVKTHFWY